MNDTDRSHLFGSPESGEWPQATSRQQQNELTKLQRTLLCVFVLAPLFVATYFFSFMLRVHGFLNKDEMIVFLLTFSGVVSLKMMVFLWYRVHHILGRYVTFQDLIILIKASTISLFVLVAIIYYLSSIDSIPRDVLMFDWGLTILAVGGLLAVLRVLHENNWPPFAFFSKRVPTLIVGANEAGESLLYAILRNRKMQYHVVGFIDEDPERVGTRIGSSRVLGTLPETCQIASSYGVSEILITTGGLSGRQVRRLVDEARQRQMRVKVLPSYEELISGRLAMQPRAVAIEDLLRREPVKLELENIRHWIDDRVLMVTGSAGQHRLGNLSAIAPIFAQTPDIGRSLGNRTILPRTRIVAISNQRGNRRSNRRSTRRETHARSARDLQARHHFPRRRLQTRSVDGKTSLRSHPKYHFRHAQSGQSGHGMRRRFVRDDIHRQSGQSNQRHGRMQKGCRTLCSIARRNFFQPVLSQSDLETSWIHPAGVVPIFRQQIARGGPVTVTDPGIVRYFMTIPEASQLVIQAGTIGNGGEILVLDMGEPVRIVDLATDMIRLSGLEVGRDIEIVFYRPASGRETI